jgi:sec-independent protein translocase protein TatB
MFDVGFSEILVIAVVALVVIGPERLPKVARTLGHLLGRAQRYVSGLKAEVSREMELEELRQTQKQMQHEMGSAEQAVRTSVLQLDQQLQQLDVPIEQSQKTYTEPILRARKQTAPDTIPEQHRFPID